MQHNDSLRALLDRHFTEWSVLDKRDHMEVHGWLKPNGVQIRMSGTRQAVVETIQALIASLLVSERLPE